MKHFMGRSRINELFLTIVLLGVVCIPRVWGEGVYDLTISAIDSGGGTSIGGTYTLNGSVGQPGAEIKKGGTYILLGGFLGSEIETEEISSTDVLQHILAVKVLTGEKLALADANRDDKVDIADVITLVNRGR